jgi:hypothetical protein
MNSGFAFVWQTSSLPRYVDRLLISSQSFSNAPEQRMAVEETTKMMKARLGPGQAELSEKLIPTKFGFGCRWVYALLSADDVQH